MSQLVLAAFIKDETAETLTETIVPLVSDLVPETGACMRTDNAPAFQRMVNLSKENNSPFRKLKIEIELGDTLNPNKNPVGENAVKEMEKEFLRLGLSNKQLTSIDLAMAVRNINSRIRNRGFSSREICVKRSQTTNESIKIND